MGYVAMKNFETVNQVFLVLTIIDQLQPQDISFLVLYCIFKNYKIYILLEQDWQAQTKGRDNQKGY